MADVGARIRYLRDCYRADTRGGGIYNLLDKKLELCRFMAPEERLLSSLLERQPMPRIEAAELAKAASLYRREKSLLYMAFPIVGRPAESGRLPKVLCAPLLLFPAVLERAEVARPGGPSPADGGALRSAGLSRRLEAGEGRLNAPAIAAFLGGDEPAGERLEALLGEVPEPPFGWDELYDLVRSLEELIPDLDAQALHAFPQLMDRGDVEKAVRSARRRRKPQRQCLPACALALAPNSVETRGILFELERIAAAESHSPPLVGLLGDEPAGNDSPNSQTAGAPRHGESSTEVGTVPAVLSRAQKRILRSAANHTLTLVNGPPGTGKSYTLAAVALDHVSRGESVLIAGRRQQPLTVVEGKIEELLQAPSFAMRAGRRSQLRELKNRLQALLHSGEPLPGAPSGSSATLARDLEKTERRLARQEASLAARSGLEQRLGEQELDPEPGLAGLFQSVSKRWMRWQLDRLPDHWRLLDDYERTLDLRSRQVATRVRAAIRDRIGATLKAHHRQLKSFLQGLRARQSSRQDQLFTRVDPQVLLHAFPLWMATFADAHRALPRLCGLFDLVVIDEATQCDLASCLPIIDRGKRLVVTGDPRQLRHVSFLSRSHQRHFAQRHELPETVAEAFDYRGRSLLDRTSDALTSIDQAALLDEHFRSAPQIIAFSNREFYRGELRVMTRRPETARRRAVELRRTAGRRDQQGVNAVEAGALIDEIALWVERERELPADVCHSLGVLSPFRDQVEHLEQAIRGRFELGASDKHDLLIGTPCAFQGEERDVMFLSLAVDAAAHPGSFVFLNRPDVFNVAITRARNHQFVFCSLGPDEAGSPLLRRYLEEIGSPGVEPAGPQPAGPQPELREGPRAIGSPVAARRQDAFLLEVKTALESRGFRTWPAYDVAGFVIDLVAGSDDRTFGIDLIGHPGPYAEAFDLERCRMLKRAGLDVFPLPYSAWQSDPAACLDALEEFRLIRGHR